MGPTFVLEGIGGVHNYGCEAIVRGTVRILRRAFPGARIIYATPRPVEDAGALRDAHVEVVAGWSGPPLIRTACNALMRLLHMRYRCWERESVPRWLGRADCVLSIGGDRFTLSPDNRLSARLVSRAHRILDHGTPLVLWGASVGPFETNPEARDLCVGLLRRLPLVTVREGLTAAYVQQLGAGARAKLVHDPAMAMLADKSAAAKVWQPRVGRRTVGVNLSPLSTAYAGGKDAVLPQQVGAVAEVLRRWPDIDVLLLPHVVCPWRPDDDDFAYLQSVKCSMPEPIRDRVQMLPAGLGASCTKGIISQCDFVVAARMHCGLASVSSGVPTLFLSYSRKAIGMCVEVYGDTSMVLPVDSPSSVLAETVSGLITRADEVRDYLRRKAPDMVAQSLEAGHLLRSLVP